MSWIPLPEGESSVELSLLDGGSFTANYALLHAGVEDKQFRMYNFSFHIFHSQTGRHVLWDVGCTSNSEDYCPWVNKFMIQPLKAVSPRRSIIEQLVQGGTIPEQISSVVFSHAHWDHCRAIKELFPNATGYFGPGTTEFCSPGHLSVGDSQWDGRFFDPHHKTEVWDELTGPWQKFGPFDRALDFFDDGSFWVIQAPGHMPGNLCAAVRLQGGEWVVLGSDCCHSRELFDGVHQIAVWHDAHGKRGSLQGDISAAKDTIGRIRIMEKKLGAHVAFAHDATWIKAGTNKVLMSLLNKNIDESSRKRLSLGHVL